MDALKEVNNPWNEALTGKWDRWRDYSDILRPLCSKMPPEVRANVMANDINGCRENSEMTYFSKN